MVAADDIDAPEPLACADKVMESASTTVMTAD